MPIRRRTTRRRRVGRPRKRTVGGRRTVRRTVRRGRGWFGNVWGKIKSKVSDLWNNNKGMLQAKALSLANQAKDKALNYAREKKLLSSAVNKILPSRFGIDKLASNYVAKSTGMGRRRRRVGRPRKRITGRGFFGNLWSGVKNLGGTVTSAVLPIATNLAKKAIVSKLGGRLRRKPRRRAVRRGRGAIGGIIGSMLPW